jgi:hypothetical protein
MNVRAGSQRDNRTVDTAVAYCKSFLPNHALIRAVMVKFGELRLISCVAAQ